MQTSDDTKKKGNCVFFTLFLLSVCTFEVFAFQMGSHVASVGIGHWVGKDDLELLIHKC